MKFSIVTPSFNCARWLPQCVASVADQAVDLEHFVQDGGSTDGTLDWLAGRTGLHVQVAEDAGMYDAINRGFERGDGELCAYLNCDEQYLPGALTAVHAHFAADPKTDVLFAHTVGIDAQGGFVCHRKALVPQRDHTLLCHLATLSAATFFRRRLLDAGHRFDPAYRAAGDVDWIARMLSANVQMRVLDRFTSVFTFTGDNLSRSDIAVAEQSRLRGMLPGWRRILRPAVSMHHRLRKWVAGAYRQKAFEYAVYVPEDDQRRKLFSSGPCPSWRWPTSR